MNITNVVGKKVMHGSPGYENEETISMVTILEQSVTIEFKSGCYSTMTCDEFEHLVQDEEVDYREKHHGGISHIVFWDWPYGSLEEHIEEVLPINNEYFTLVKQSKLKVKM